jgi:hypothetical protein
MIQCVIFPPIHYPHCQRAAEILDKVIYEKKTKIGSIFVQSHLNSIYYIVLRKYSGELVVQYKIKDADVLDGMTKFII